MCSKNPSHAIFRVALSLRLPASYGITSGTFPSFLLFDSSSDPFGRFLPAWASSELMAS